MATLCASLDRCGLSPGPGPLDIDKTVAERKWNVQYGGLA